MRSSSSPTTPHRHHFQIHKHAHDFEPSSLHSHVYTSRLVGQWVLVPSFLH